MNHTDKQNLIVYITHLSHPDFEEWVNIASTEEIDVALEYYKERHQQRVEAELKKYEAQAREVIQKAMRR